MGRTTPPVINLETRVAVASIGVAPDGFARRVRTSSGDVVQCAVGGVG